MSKLFVRCSRCGEDSMHACNDPQRLCRGCSKKESDRAAAVSAAERAVVAAAERWHEAEHRYEEMGDWDSLKWRTDKDIQGNIEEAQRRSDARDAALESLRSACSALAAARGGEGKA